MATCIIDMYPTNRMFSWKLFATELSKVAQDGDGPELILGVQKISQEAKDRKRLMNYGVFQARWDIAYQARTRTGQYFGIPGNKSEEDIIKAVNWLLQGQRYSHKEVDIQAKTSNELPFLSPLFALVLRGYFVKYNPEQDQILVDHLWEQQKVPIPLIAMVGALYATGSKTKSDIPLTSKNVGPIYRNLMETIKLLEKDTPEYVSLVQTCLYNEMMSTGQATLLVQVYSTSKLNAYALTQKKSKDSKNNAPQDSEAVAAQGSKDTAEVLCNDGENPGLSKASTSCHGSTDSGADGSQEKAVESTQEGEGS
ncbi:hypothetical protein F5890DRAFT_1558272 [Lentinula detonsa]|uniref:DUF6532 domain-containing protein n=1 Tax=Lentinula detonsa TaxID=2804962 RepID=A0AA38PQE4_9AGAR|nr:hypothetical protein F5890DRAFT_1558272 [Lentinula detonsa]